MKKLNRKNDLKHANTKVGNLRSLTFKYIGRSQQMIVGVISSKQEVI